VPPCMVQALELQLFWQLRFSVAPNLPITRLAGTTDEYGSGRHFGSSLEFSPSERPVRLLYADVTGLILSS